MKESNLSIVYTTPARTQGDNAHLEIHDNGSIIFDQGVKQSVLITGDYIEVSTAIRNALKVIKDSYDFHKQKINIKSLSILIEGENNIIRSIVVDNLASIYNEFRIQNPYLIKSLHIGNTHYKNHVQIPEIIVHGPCESLKLSNLDIKFLNITQYIKNTEILICNIENFNLNIKAKLIDSISKKEVQDGIKQFKDCVFGRIEIISGLTHSVSLHELRFEGCQFNRMLLIKGLNIGDDHIKGLVFIKCNFNLESIFQLSECNIFLFQLLEVSTQKIEIYNSNFTHVFFSQSNIDKILLVSGNIRAFYELLQSSLDGLYKVSIPEIKEFYRQLKYSHDQIGNKTEANKFFAKEMEYYRKSLEWKDWDKKIISLIQELSNGYGNSWIRPSLWILFFSGVKTYSSSIIIFNGNYYQYFKEFIEKLILNINLIDDFKDISNPFEFIYRLLLAFFIYQFLVALRRISQR